MKGQALLAIILAFLALLMIGCASLPPMDSTRLIKRMMKAYATCHSFEDSGSIREVEVKSNETNITLTSYQIQFIRARAFRMELNAERTHGIGAYSLVYHWDGRSWSRYDSLKYYGSQPVHTNLSETSVIGSGLALSFGLFPLMPQLLHLADGEFRGFRYNYNTAQVFTDRLRGKAVYRLKLRWDLGVDHDTEEYWIDPDTFTILQRRERSTRNSGDVVKSTTRETKHSPRLDTLSPDALIEFSPPTGYALERGERNDDR